MSIMVTHGRMVSGCNREVAVLKRQQGRSQPINIGINNMAEVYQKGGISEKMLNFVYSLQD